MNFLLYISSLLLYPEVVFQVKLIPFGVVLIDNSPPTNVSTTPKKESPRSHCKSQSSSPTKNSKKLSSSYRQHGESSH